MLLFSCLFAVSARAGTLTDFLASTPAAEVVPGADHYGAVEGKPPVVPVYAGDKQVGYVYLNSDVVNTAGYSSKPIDILIGLSMDGEIVGAKLVEHHEPIVLIGIPMAKITHFIDGYIGLNFVKNPPSGRMKPPVDIVSGATVTLMVIGDSITRSAIAMARTHGIGRPAEQQQAVGPKWQINADLQEKLGWDALLGDGSVRRLQLSVDDVNQGFLKADNAAAAAHPESDDPQDLFIEMYTAQVSVPSIGLSLLGDALYQRLQSQLKPGQQAILVAGQGLYSFKGSGYVRGGIFDRIEMVQGDRSFRFRDRNHQRLANIMAEGAPRFPEIALFVVPEDQPFDAVAPWQLQLLIQRTLSVSEKAFVTVDLPYEVPERYLRQDASAQPAVSGVASAATGQADTANWDESEDTPLWKQMWSAKVVQLTVLGIALFVLTLVFFAQNWFARHPVFYDRFRLTYLSFTLFWLGGYCVAQLSVVNVLTFTHALRTGFQWEYFLMDPIVFVLWCATAVSGLFWNRGAFCGWLCPFGALQELLNRLARVVKIPQLKIPYFISERMAAMKYVIFLILFGLSLYDLGFAEKMSEVEPFKTSIILKFVREWPFVLFALVLLGLGLFVERFYCRYLCPLGAALAIPARLRLFDWLRRYRECGDPCQRCAVECPVNAIHPEGHINPNECIQCLNCQVLYHHKQKCPHLIKKHAKRAKKPAPGMAAGQGMPEAVELKFVPKEELGSAGN
ncbi:regulatory protein NosR [Corticimicrobacter populi]|uniref:Regulatory protein NosR n=2 Tax=Corticimicrobacter populi TaxID=2175229 RepID=A0A2V1JYN4_9BURK|nr:regulatory protein NosR [Corticimicrobacter populi]